MPTDALATAKQLGRDDVVRIPEHDAPLRVHRTYTYEGTGVGAVECYDETGAKRLLIERSGELRVARGSVEATRGDYEVVSSVTVIDSEREQDTVEATDD